LRNVAQNPSDSFATVYWQTEQTDLHPGQPIKFIDAGKRSGAKNSVSKTGCTIALSLQVTIQPYLTRRLIMLSFRAAARNLERLLMRPKPRIPRVARNDKVR
jgi:hypothetical protein